MLNRLNQGLEDLQAVAEYLEESWSIFQFLATKREAPHFIPLLSLSEYWKQETSQINQKNKKVGIDSFYQLNG